MKKTLLIALVFCLAGLLAWGCGSGGGTSSTTTGGNDDRRDDHGGNDDHAADGLRQCRCECFEPDRFCVHESGHGEVRRHRDLGEYDQRSAFHRMGRPDAQHFVRAGRGHCDF